MIRLKKNIPVLAFVALSLTFYMASAHSQSSSPTRMIFAVWPAQRGKQPDKPILDPIVMLDGSRFKEPLKYGDEKPEEAEAMFNDFVKRYFQRNQEYSMLLGGSEYGKITVEQTVGISCESLSATVKISVQVPNNQKALAATSVQGLGLHANWHEPPTPEQKSAFLKHSANFLRQQGVVSVSPSGFKVRNLRSTKLGEGQPLALIGSVRYKDKSAAHNLFLVLQQKDQQWEIAMTSYHLTKDVEDYVDDVEEDFVDQLDLDNDGVDEIVTMSGYYESWDYSIYKQQKGKWEKVYQGGGGGC